MFTPTKKRELRAAERLETIAREYAEASSTEHRQQLHKAAIRYAAAALELAAEHVNGGDK